MTTDNRRILCQITLCLLTLVVAAPMRGQGVDTTRLLRAVELEHQLDSLRENLRRIDAELQTTKARMAEGTDLERLLASLGEEEEENVPEDQRSRRKRVDAMLKAITARPGQLRFNGGATSSIQVNPRRPGSFATGTASLDLFAHTNVGGTTLLFFGFEAIGGDGPDRHVATFTSLNADAGSTQDIDGVDRLTVNEAWAEFSVLEEAVTVTAGKIDLTNYFDNNGVANDETSQFLSAAFVNSAALAVPGSTPGVRVRTTLFERLFLQAGLARAENSGENIFSDLFKIASVGFRTFAESEHEGNVRVYGYAHPAAGNAGGVGLSLDQAVGSGMTVFGRWGRNSTEVRRLLGIGRSWSAGWRYIASLAGRKLVVAIAYGETHAEMPGFRNERDFEAYARHHLNRWAQISFHIQAVWNAGGAAEHVLIAGVRSQLNF